MLIACQQGGEPAAPGTAPEGFTGIGPEEVIRFGGTEPFWGGSIDGGRLTYTTPENIDGTVIGVDRFTGQGGLGFSGTLGGESFDMTITPGECSDGMSDRTYPYVAILQIGDGQRAGCAHTDSQPYVEDVPQ
ncbi:COG3650 family protein [Erythrobacter litoralis]|uniref:Uncharacterized protein n=1 Tax=Erythrobacter litoralis (strain HTCC2594) TaxID=314225 RepID=Q2N8F8_ERYLH|nr:hypothetical protein [Erythrobacter litoralis]ABC64033.1 hypothetical protein ELI_09705 [Erythrobacter litoralis HTCC2594]